MFKYQIGYFCVNTYYCPMKFLSTILLSVFTVFVSHAQEYQVNLSAPQYHEGIAYLTYYYGKNMNIADSAVIGANGETVFQGQKKLSPGIYSVVLPGKRISFDFLVSEEQHINVMIKDSANPIASAVVSGSKENIPFREYQKFVTEKGTALEHERQAYLASKTKADSSLHENNYIKLNRELNNFRDSIITGFPESMLAVLFKTMKEPEVLHKNPRTSQDSTENYYYYKEHYWDGVTFRDDRIIRTPFFIPKLERYFRQVINQNADSVIRESDYLILLSRTNQPMYQFLLNWFTDEYFQPKVMGQDKVFVHLFEKYHSQGISTWLNEKQHKAISDRAYMVMSNLIGEPAAPLLMTDLSGKETPLYQVKSDFTVVSFWDPNCGHCRTEMPVLDSIYQAKWKAEGVKIYAVLTDNAAKDKWKSFIDEHRFNDWVNVYESDKQEKAVEASNKPSYRQLYDVIQTPTIYLLDKEKRIIAKKLTIQQMDDLIDTKLKNDKQK